MLLLTDILLIDIALGWFGFSMEADFNRELKSPSFSPTLLLLLPKDETLQPSQGRAFTDRVSKAVQNVTLLAGLSLFL